MFCKIIIIILILKKFDLRYNTRHVGSEIQEWRYLSAFYYITTRARIDSIPPVPIATVLGFAAGTPQWTN